MAAEAAGELESFFFISSACDAEIARRPPPNVSRGFFCGARPGVPAGEEMPSPTDAASPPSCSAPSLVASPGSRSRFFPAMPSASFAQNARAPCQSRHQRRVPSSKITSMHNTSYLDYGVRGRTILLSLQTLTAQRTHGKVRERGTHEAM